jgi:hypothetical protein
MFSAVLFTEVWQRLKDELHLTSKISYISILGTEG